MRNTSYLDQVFLHTIIAYISKGMPAFVDQIPFRTRFLREIARQAKEREDDIVAIITFLLDLIFWIQAKKRSSKIQRAETYFGVETKEIDGVTGTTTTETVMIEETYYRTVRVRDEFAMGGIRTYQVPETRQVPTQREVFVPFDTPRATTAQLAIMATAVGKTITSTYDENRLSEMLKTLIKWLARRLARWTEPNKDLVQLTAQLIQNIKPEPPEVAEEEG